MPVIQVRGEAAAQTITENRISKYIKLWETYVDHNNIERKRLWTCWFHSEQQNSTGEDFIIEGDLSCKIGSYTSKQTNEEKTAVEYHLNNCVVIKRSGDLIPVPPTDLNDAPF